LPERFGSLHKAGSKKMTDHTTLAAGIDTAKAKLDVAIQGSSDPFTVENDRAGWRRLAGVLTAAGVGRVGIEATGGYEQGVVAALRAAGFTVLLFQPLQVKAYARLHLRRAKNDRLDARLIAACAAALEAPPIAPDPRLSALAEALTFIEQGEEDIARLKTRLEHQHAPRLRRLAETDIKRLQNRRAAELRRLRAAVARHDDLARRLDLILSVPGIGERTALAILIRLPEIGHITREQAAALAGLAPFDDDTGQHQGQRHIAGGRARLRRSLYAAALPAAFRWNPNLQSLYQRLLARGKTHKSALIACARKLLIFANTVVARGTPWTPAPHSSP
jgi:transposase